MSIRVVRAGLLTTVQDCGRSGWQRHGVVVGGAMDSLALRVANLLVGNEEDDAALEATLLGPTLAFDDDHLFALTGGDLGAQLNDVPVPLGRPCLARAGSVLLFTGARSGCRCCIAIAGGIDVTLVLGSRSTDVRAGIGGVEGRALVAGDVLPVGVLSVRATAWLRGLAAGERVVASWGVSRTLSAPPALEPVVRVVRGIDYDLFDDASRAALFESAFVVSARADRMGYRLEGPRLTLDAPRELLSAPIALGTIQVPPGGEAIVLMADRQSVGGYPRIAQVITVDVPVLAQAAPGTRIRFREVELAEAQALLVQREKDLRLLAVGLRVMGDGF